MKRFLIINPFGIGDILFTTPVIRAIKESLPDSFIAYWCNARVKEILEDNPRVDKLFGLSRGDIKKIYRDSFFSGMYASVGLWQSIRKANFDTAIDFSLDYRYALTASLAGIKKRIGFDYKNRGRFLTDAITIAGYKDKHMVEHNLDLLAFIGLTASFKNLEIFVLQKIEEISIRFLRKQGVTHDDALIGLVPGGGASWGGDAGLKRWPVENFAKLAQELLQKKGVKIVILGDESERPLADIIIGMLKDKAIDLVGKTNLRELAGIISHLKVLVTNDGGPLHMAVACGVKTVSIFGPVDEKVYGPYPSSQDHRVIANPVPCRPCYQDFKMPRCKHESICVTSIRVEDVLQNIESLL